MGINDAINKTNAISKSNANVKIVLGDCKANIDVDAASLELWKGDGALDLDVDLSNDLFASTGEGNNVVNANVGGSAKFYAEDGEQILNITADSIVASVGTGNVQADLFAENDIKLYADDTDEGGLHFVNAKSENGDVKAIVGNGEATMILDGADVVAIAGETGKSRITVDASKNAIIETESGDDTVIADVGGFAYINVGSTDSEKSDNDDVKLTAKSDVALKDDYADLIANTYKEVVIDENGKAVKDEKGNYVTQKATRKAANLAGTNYVSLGDDNDKAAIFADDVTLEKNNGELTAGVMGDDVDVTSLAEKNLFAAYGNRYDINVLTSAQNDIRTMDYMLRDGSDNKEIILYETDEDGEYILDENGDKIPVRGEDGKIVKVALKDTANVADTAGNKQTLNAYDEANNATEVQWFKDNFTDAFDQETIMDDVDKYELISTKVETDGMSADEIADKYNLSDQERAILKSVDLTQEFGNTGAPLYSLALSPKKSKAAGHDVYVVVKTDSSNGNYLHARAVSDNECIAFNIIGTTAAGASNVKGNIYQNIDSAEKAEDITGSKKVIEEYKYNANYKTDGVMDWSITGYYESDDDSKLNAFISAYDGYVEFNYGQLDSNRANIKVNGSHIDSVEKGEKEITVEDWALSVYVQKNSWNSPLILDMNGDGKVSSVAGIGVDTDGDGTVDGAATNGDKMLAMSDLNGNNTVDAAEVFGNNTISPFTGEKLNAANGFEALKMIAEEAEEYTGITCIKGSQVDMAALAKALESVGVKLGFISDENNTTLEEFSGVKTISTEYDDKTYEGGEQRQYGTFVTTDGDIRDIQDIWFQ